MVPERLRIEGVEGAHDRPPEVGVFLLRRPEPVGRIEDRVVDAHLLDARREQRREQRGGTIERVAGGQAPPRDPDHARAPHLLRRQASHGRGATRRTIERGRGILARLLFQDVADDGEVLDGVAVGVDDRMVETRLDPANLVAGHELHPGELYCGVSAVTMGRSPGRWMCEASPGMRGA